MKLRHTVDVVLIPGVGEVVERTVTCTCATHILGSDVEKYAIRKVRKKLNASRFRYYDDAATITKTEVLKDTK